MRESTELEAQGVKLRWPGGAVDAFWPVIPKDAELTFNQISPDEVEIAHTRWTKLTSIGT